jgi:4,5-dihydroxyphthalate decarboxylase
VPDEVATLKSVLADYPHTLPLKRGEVRSGTVALDFHTVKPIAQAFKPMVREQAFDVSELALVTYLQARAYGKPVVMLPTTMLGRFQHHCMLYNSERGHLTPADLPGRRVGIRSYAQTTAVWLRGILQNDYGVDVSRIRWVVFEDAHVAEYIDPSGIERAGPGKDLTTMLLAGEIDAAIYGAAMPDDSRLQSVIPDPHQAALAWHRRHGVVPINHVVAAKQALAAQNPDAVSEVYRMLTEGKKIAGAPTPVDTIPFGFDAIRPALALALTYAQQQKLLPGPMTADDVTAMTRSLVRID